MASEKGGIFGTFVIMPIVFFQHLHFLKEDRVVKIRPAASLREVVEGFYLFKANNLSGRQLLFSDGYPAAVIQSISDSINRITIDGEVKTLGAMWLCHGVLKNVYWEIEDKVEELFVIRFHPVSFYKLFNHGEDFAQGKQVFNFSETAASGFENFANAYYQSIRLEEKIKVVETFLLDKIKRCSYPAILADIVNFIQEKQGNTTVKQLLEEQGIPLNYKWLERNFKKHLGISPQQYILLHRFLHAYMDLASCPSRDLLKIALDKGYCDVNHLIKDFRQYSGVSPKAYFRDAVGKRFSPEW